MKRSAKPNHLEKSNVKILNDTAASSSSTSPTKVASLTLTDISMQEVSVNVLGGQQNKMDHYVMQTVKIEPSLEGTNSTEAIDFVLTTTDSDNQPKFSGEIMEELCLSDGNDDDNDDDDDDDDEEDDNAGPKHQEIIEHVCGKCFRTFRRLKGLKKHLDYCRFDSGYRQRKAEMLKNLDKIEKDAIMMENKDICFCCGESYDTYHLGHINCPDCPKSFKTQMSYERHIFINHSEKDDFPCSVCNAKLRSSNLLKLHEDQHKTRGKPFACKVCGKEFTRSYHLQRHNKYSSCTASETTTVVCKVCNKSFYRLDNLRAHLKQHLGTHVTKKREYMCPICKNCFYSLSTLNIHTRTHTGERPFDCDLCVKKFPSLVALKKHRRYHTGEKPYTCSICQQSFAVKEVLNRHMKRHTGERPYVCNECGKSFIQGVQLRNHIKTHLRPYECNECPEKFKTEKQLERHQKEHRPQAQRRGRSKSNHNCEKCKRSFRTEELFEHHMSVGIHISPAQKRKLKNRTDCTVCNKKFESVQSLKFHILKVHQDDPESNINNAQLEEEQNLSNTESSLSTKTSTRETRANTKTQSLVSPKHIKLEQPSESDVEILYDTVKENNGDNIKNCTKVSQKEAECLVSSKNPVLQEYIADNGNIVNDHSTPSREKEDKNSKNIVPDTEVICVEKCINMTSSSSDEIVQKKSLAESLVAAVADNDNKISENSNDKVVTDTEKLTSDDLKLKLSIRKLLDVMVDKPILEKLGWPKKSEEDVICKVIENCGHNLSKDAYNYSDWDYGTRMREYTKLLFTVVLRNNSIKELLNNYQVDEVIDFVLGNYEDEDGSKSDEELVKTDKKEEQFGNQIKTEGKWKQNSAS